MSPVLLEPTFNGRPILANSSERGRSVRDPAGADRAPTATRSSTRRRSGSRSWQAIDTTRVARGWRTRAGPAVQPGRCIGPLLGPEADGAEELRERDPHALGARARSRAGRPFPARRSEVGRADPVAGGGAGRVAGEPPREPAQSRALARAAALRSSLDYLRLLEPRFSPVERQVLNGVPYVTRHAASLPFLRTPAGRRLLREGLHGRGPDGAGETRRSFASSSSGSRTSCCSRRTSNGATESEARRLGPARAPARRATARDPDRCLRRELGPPDAQVVPLPAAGSGLRLERDPASGGR